MIKNVLALAILFLIGFQLNSQSVPLGNWKDYSPYRDIISVVKSGNVVYGATANGVLAWNVSDNTTENLNKVNALSDIGISQIKYSSQYNYLIVAYINGNVDLVGENNTINISDIKKSSIIGDKSIYNVFIKGKLAYFSCGFGIVVLDLERQEIKESYIIGPGGTQVVVNQVLIDGGYIYAATEKGLYRALENNPFLNDFSAWSLVSGLSNTVNTNFNAVTTLNGQIIVNKNNIVNAVTDTVFAFQGGVWNIINEANGGFLRSIYAGNGKLLLNYYDSVKVFDNSITLQEKLFKYNSFWQYDCNDIVWDGSNYYAGDRVAAIVQAQANEVSNIRLPVGPSTSLCRDIEVENGHLWGSTGLVKGTNWNSSYNLAGVFHYDIINNKWDINRGVCFNAPGPDQGKCIYDFIGVGVNPNEPEKGYGCSFSPKGIVEFKDNEREAMYDSTNSSLQVSLIHFDRFAVADVDFDENNNMWGANTWVNEPLILKTSNGTWESFYCGNEATKQIYSYIIVDKTNGYKWMVAKSKFVVAYNTGEDVLDKSDDEYKILKSGEGNGNIHAPPTCIAEDLDGEIWIGTEEGVTILYNPINVFEGGDFDAQQIKIEQDGNVEFLLSTDNITCITVDGGNRKWIGTISSGVYVFSPDGQELIHHFTFDNSPLYSNKINDIAIDGQTGEAFISTEDGLLSYRNVATEGGVTFTDVYAFPNPVQPSYTGPITITGLMKDSDVRIADLSGNVVYAGKSIGGQAIWNRKNLDGNEVQSGVYFVFLAGPDGRKKEATKILVLD